jgi:hypothetical protein
LSVPVERVSAIYARENGAGMAFEVGSDGAMTDEALVAASEAECRRMSRHRSRRAQMRGGRSCSASNRDGSFWPAPKKGNSCREFPFFFAKSMIFRVAYLLLKAGRKENHEN